MAALLRALGARNRTEAAYKAGHLVDSTGLADAEDRLTVINRHQKGRPNLLTRRILKKDPNRVAVTAASFLYASTRSN